MAPQEAQARHTLVAVKGSEPPARFAAKAIGPASQNELITVTVKVRSKADESAHSAALEEGREAVHRDAFAATYGADPAALKRVEDYAKGQGLTVVESSAAKRRVVLHGKVADFESAFGVTLERFEHPGGTFRSHSSPVHVPEHLGGDVEAVLGLSNRPVAKPHFQYQRKMPVTARGLRAATAGPLSPLDVARLYNFPTGLDGAGQSIAIIELGGGFILEDLRTYFSGIGIAPAPEVVDVGVLGANNTPGDDADGEVMLDIEVAGAIAPKAKIVVSFAPNTDQGFVQAITNAAHDTENKPSVISISWGGPESAWRRSAVNAMNNALRDAVLLGVTVTVAAGDNGSDDGVGDRQSHVDFPASSPFALACGGTRLVGDGATISSETVWDDGPSSATGGGVSDLFPVPSYQSGANVPTSVSTPGFRGRGVPDVSGDADPVTGYNVRVDGRDTVVGGTSAVAPLWAGLIALLNQSLGKPVGFLNPLLYGSVAGKGAFRDITEGDNGAFSAGPGWDACTGLGSPDGAKILAALGAAPAATPAPASARTAPPQGGPEPVGA
jgi:kumamolisin